MNIILFGAPGSGKGTQGQILCKEFGLTHCNMGSLLRTEYERKTTIGIEAAKYWLNGNLSPNELVIEIFNSYLENIEIGTGILFDGIPRQLEQAYALDEALKQKGNKVDHLLNLQVPDNVLITRLLGRGKTSNRADDKDIEIIKHRLQVYKSETLPVLNYYKNICLDINGDGLLEDITECIKTTLVA